jgi:16S rRNA (adenine1518-N6/adenine1519-N6)-dimethyltransferase
MGKYLEQPCSSFKRKLDRADHRRPGTRDIRFLTVATQLSAETKLLFKVPPGAFSPPPKVDSAVIRLTPRRREGESPDSHAIACFRRLCFRQKRKTLRNNLTASSAKK